MDVVTVVVPAQAGTHVKCITPAKAEVHRTARERFSTRPVLRDALLKGLYLSDPWVPAFAGMETKLDET